MAISFTVRGTALHDDVDRASYSYTGSSLTAGRNYVLFVSLTHASAAPTATPTATGETFTEHGTAGGVLYASNARRVQAFRFTASATGTKTITIGSSATATSCDAVVVEVQGEDTTSPVANSTSGSQTANTSRTVTLPVFANTANRGLIFLANGSAAAGQLGVDSPWTMLDSGGHANPNNGSMTAGNTTDDDRTAVFTWSANVQAAWFGFEFAIAPASIPVGSGSGTWSWSGTSSGTSSRSGAGSGTWTFAGVAAGTTTKRGSATGSWSFSGTATGDSPPNDGTASGTWSFTGTAAGQSARRGTGTGSWAFAGAGSGNAPEAGDPGSGSAVGAWSFTGTSTGTTTRRGVTTGTWSWSGTSSGTSTHRGSGTGGMVTWAGAAQGTTTSRAAASGTWSFTGTGLGSAPAPEDRTTFTGSSSLPPSPTGSSTTLQWVGSTTLVTVGGVSTWPT